MTTRSTRRRLGTTMNYMKKNDNKVSKKKTRNNNKNNNMKKTENKGNNNINATKQNNLKQKHAEFNSPFINFASHPPRPLTRKLTPLSAIDPDIQA